MIALVFRYEARDAHEFERVYGPEGEQAAYGVFDNNIVPPAFRPKVLEG